MSEEGEQETQERVITGEELLEALKRSEIVAADRLVIIRSFEKFFSTVEAGRSTLMADINEINNARMIRDGAVIPDDISESESPDTEEE